MKKNILIYNGLKIATNIGVGLLCARSNTSRALIFGVVWGTIAGEIVGFIYNYMCSRVATRVYMTL